MATGMNWPTRSRIDRVGSWISWSILALFVIVALLAPLLATEIPIYAEKNGKRYWPAFTSGNWTDSLPEFDHVVFAPVAFPADGSPDLKMRLQPPGSINSTGKFAKVHHLGTDRLGRDVAAGLIYGCRKSIGIAILAMTVSALIGILFGATAGYWGNRLTIPLTGFTVILVLGAFFCIYLWYYQFVSGWIIWFFPITFLTLCLTRHSRSRKKFHFPLDMMVLKLIEIFQSIPALLLLIVIAGLIESPSLITLALLISLIRWTSFARFSRAEVVKITARDYITAARVSGLRSWKIIGRYIMPEAFGPLVVVFAFGVSSVIMLESTLSFLGIGIPVEEVTWGTLLSQARNYGSAWWLAVFPGLCILLIVFSLNLIGSQLKQKFDPQD